jgi:hypothetical protein
MNTIYSTLVLLVSLATSVQAQDTSVSIKCRYKGGYNLAAVRFDGSGETGQRNGFHIGVYGESFISESSSNPNYCILNKATIKDANGTFTKKLDYINLPIPLAYPLSLEAGPQIGLAISKKEEYDGLFSSSQEYILILIGV